jgi:hypothetical protein
MSFEQAPHVDLNLPTPGLDSSSTTHITDSSNGSTLQNAKTSAINSEVSRRKPQRRLDGCRADKLTNATQSTFRFPSLHQHPLEFPSHKQTAAQSAMDTISNHPATQNAKDAVVNGEVRCLAPAAPSRCCPNHEIVFVDLQIHRNT